MPALIDGDAQIFDSTIILEYLEDKYPSPPLLPRDPVARANARMIEDVCDTLYEAVNWGLSEIRWYKRAEGELADKMKETAARQTAELQTWLTEKLGTAQWFNGESFGWADLSVAPYLNRSFHYGLCTPEGSPLAKWRHRIRERPSVATTFREFEAACERMVDAAARVASGTIRREYRDPSPGMDDEVGRRAGRARRHGQEHHPFHLAAWLNTDKIVIPSTARDLSCCLEGPSLRSG